MERRRYRLVCCEPPECRCAGLLNIRVRRQAGVGIRFPRGKRTHSVRAVGVQLGMKVMNIRGQRLDSPILRRDDDQTAGASACHKPAMNSARALPDRPDTTRPYRRGACPPRCGGNPRHRRCVREFYEFAFREFPYRARRARRSPVVDCPSINGKRHDLPTPAFDFGFDRRCCPSPQSAPFTSTSGWIFKNRFKRRVFVETHRRNPPSPFRRAVPHVPASGMIGRFGPFIRCTDASVLMATTSTSPSARARRRRSMCPECKMSKQPLVKTTFLPDSLVLYEPFLEIALTELISAGIGIGD